jgi:Holliday junction resolvasome RuvABC endonuclease subunit
VTTTSLPAVSPQAVGGGHSSRAGLPVAIGLDLSLTSTGIASSATFLTRLVKSTGRTSDSVEIKTTRMIRIAEEIAGLVRGADLVVIEGPAYAQGAMSGAHARAGLWWMVAYEMHLLRVPVAVATPGLLKMYATGKGNASKEDVLVAAIRRLPGFHGLNDEADAAWLAALGADHLGHPTVEVPAGHRRALLKVEWPTLARAA